eukprot:gb/GFBE01073205.1/.p1 GENE.gb/GFBE01073205.1/~~gb/GFBE01073205.1/.p1  ORF type:complete len:236 (+),score=19.95 gb/GFBE01073205.1/:1-708(+)
MRRIRLQAWARRQLGQRCCSTSQETVKQSHVIQPRRPWTVTTDWMKKHPFATNMLLCTTVTPLCDFNVQRVCEDSMDKHRLAAFVAFGVYQGFAWWYWYMAALGRLFPHAMRFANLPLAQKWGDRSGALQLLGQIAADLLLYVPLFYFPIFYVFNGSFHGLSATDSLQRYRKNCFEDNVMSWSFWVPADILCFIVPAWLRMPMCHLTGVGWTSIISYSRGGNVKSIGESEAASMS